MNTTDIFSAPISNISYPYHSFLKKQILSIMEEECFESNKVSENLFHYKNSKNYSILYDDRFKNFKTWVEDVCYNYVTEILGYHLDDKIIITDSWLNKCNTGGFQYPHYHTNSYISGTYYINFEEGHAPLIFVNDDISPYISKQTISLEKSKTSTKYNSNVIFFPKESELYLWQSHLTHGISDNEKDNRISISMNFMPTSMTNQRYGYKVFY